MYDIKHIFWCNIQVELKQILNLTNMGNKYQLWFIRPLLENSFTQLDLMLADERKEKCVK